MNNQDRFGLRGIDPLLKHTTEKNLNFKLGKAHFTQGQDDVTR